MIPSASYFPTSLVARAAWFANFSAKFSLVAASLGFEPEDVTAVQADNQLIQFLLAAETQGKAVDAARRQFRKVITEGAIGEPTPSWPSPFTGEPADPPPPTGVFERLDDLVKRIRSAPNYTAETGALLGIIPVKPDPISPDFVKPEPSVMVLPGNRVNVVFKRGQMSGIDIEVQVDNSGTWQNMGRFVKSPAELVIPENAQSLPRAVQVRARYFQGNTAVGMFSDIDVVATTP